VRRTPTSRPRRRIGQTGPGALAYDLAADVPIGDVEVLRRTLNVPVKYLEGSFAAAVRVRGNGAQPNLSGNVTIPEGSYNGSRFAMGAQRLRSRRACSRRATVR